MCLVPEQQLKSLSGSLKACSSWLLFILSSQGKGCEMWSWGILSIPNCSFQAITSLLKICVWSWLVMVLTHGQPCGLMSQLRESHECSFPSPSGVDYLLCPCCLCVSGEIQEGKEPPTSLLPPFCSLNLCAFGARVPRASWTSSCPTQLGQLQRASFGVTLLVLLLHLPLIDNQPLDNEQVLYI